MTMLGPTEIHRLYQSRKKEQAQAQNRMGEIAKVYDGDVVLPIPELNRAEKPAVPNLLEQGLDQTAMRVASVMPTIETPPTKDGLKGYEERGRARKRAIEGWWDKSRMKLKMRKRARHLLGYAASPVIIKPDAELHIPRWHVRDPQSCFPDSWGEPDDLIPGDVIFANKHPIAWVKNHWGDSMSGFIVPDGYSWNSQMVVIEYFSPTQMTVVASLEQGGSDRRSGTWNESEPPAPVLLSHIPNRIGMTPVVIPKRINLNQPQGAFDGIVGMYQGQAMLMALSVLATYKGIFAEEWIMDTDDRYAEVEQTPNPLTGQPGIIHNGQIQRFPVDPQFATSQTMDRMEYNMRQTASIPAEYGGHGSTNVRTGRRGGQVLGAAIDFPIQETQEILAESLTEENRVGIAIDKTYFGKKKKSFYITWAGKTDELEYVPDDIFTTDRQIVSYAFAGVDANALAIELGQKIGMGTMSKQTAMKHDPAIPDPEAENDKVTADALRQAFVARIQAEAGNPESQFTPADFAMLEKLVLTNQMELYDAVEQVNKNIAERQKKMMEEMMEAQAKQAQAGPGGPPPGAPPMPGMAPPPPGAEDMAAIQPGNQSQQNLQGLLMNLRSPNMGVSTPSGGSA